MTSLVTNPFCISSFCVNSTLGKGNEACISQGMREMGLNSLPLYPPGSPDMELCTRELGAWVELWLFPQLARKISTCQLESFLIHKFMSVILQGLLTRSRALQHTKEDKNQVSLIRSSGEEWLEMLMFCLGILGWLFTFRMWVIHVSQKVILLQTAPFLSAQSPAP